MKTISKQAKKTYLILFFMLFKNIFLHFPTQKLTNLRKKNCLLDAAMEEKFAAF